MKKSQKESAASIALFLAICLKLNSFPSSWARCQLNWLSVVEEDEERTTKKLSQQLTRKQPVSVLSLHFIRLTFLNEMTTLDADLQKKKL